MRSAEQSFKSEYWLTLFSPVDRRCIRILCRFPSRRGAGIGPCPYPRETFARCRFPIVSPWICRDGRLSQPLADRFSERCLAHLAIAFLRLMEDTSAKLGRRGLSHVKIIAFDRCGETYVPARIPARSWRYSLHRFSVNASLISMPRS